MEEPVCPKTPPTPILNTSSSEIADASPEVISPVVHQIGRVQSFLKLPKNPKELDKFKKWLRHKEGKVYQQKFDALNKKLSQHEKSLTDGYYVILTDEIALDNYLKSHFGLKNLLKENIKFIAELRLIYNLCKQREESELSKKRPRSPSQAHDPAESPLKQQPFERIKRSYSCPTLTRL